MATRHRYGFWAKATEVSKVVAQSKVIGSGIDVVHIRSTARSSPRAGRSLPAGRSSHRRSPFASPARKSLIASCKRP